MSRSVLFSLQAEENLDKILAYWDNRNKSAVFSGKLTAEILSKAEQLAKYPEMGKPTSLIGFKEIRVNNYRLVYEYDDSVLGIVAIQDLRQEYLKP